MRRRPLLKNSSAGVKVGVNDVRCTCLYSVVLYCFACRSVCLRILSMPRRYSAGSCRGVHRVDNPFFARGDAAVCLYSRRKIGRVGLNEWEGCFFCWIAVVLLSLVPADASELHIPASSVGFCACFDAVSFGVILNCIFLHVL